ncbi:MAG: hypothetical protein ACHQ4H_09710, partial [Ktedonobacterales bacterium]
VVEEWTRVLKPGGVVITTARLANGTAVGNDGWTHGSKNEVASYASRAVEAAAAASVPFPLSPTALDGLARGYASRIASAPFKDGRALGSLFEEQGFVVDRLDVKHVKGEFSPATLYGRVLARKI